MTIYKMINKGLFYHYYQPIYDLSTWNKEGYEVLFRTDIFSSPHQAFHRAKAEKALYELEVASIYKAIQEFQLTHFVYSDYTLFINVYPSTILNPNFLNFLEEILSKLTIAKNIVFEIIEAERIHHLSIFKKSIAIIKRMGFKIAIDDLGNGNSQLSRIIEIKPDIIKLDMYFAKNLNVSKEKQFIIKLIENYCSEFNIKLVIEGLENPVELAIAKLLNVNYGRGNLLGKPQLLAENI